ncbi:MAG: protein TolR, partial [Alphaproteobacteria bacterium]|nr:protein TolR [Alphaproteobacteria bacterium]
TQRRIYVRGDAQVAYGRMAQLVAHINAAGFTRMALVTQTPQTPQ